MDSVLTTLDPGMKDFLKSDGAVDIVIASDNGRIIGAIADGFRRVFSTVTYRGMGTPGASSLLPQIVGHTFALKYAKERISLLRGSGLAGNKSAVVALQPFLHEIQGNWYESSVIAMQKDDVFVHVFTQPVDVEPRVIAVLKEHTPSGYAANAFSTTVGVAYAEVFGIDPDDWQQRSLSYSSSELYRLSSAALAAAYKRKFMGDD
ncbi:Protein PRRC1, partial [Toxocara canis]